jgi:hypothetical protein
MRAEAPHLGWKSRVQLAGNWGGQQRNGAARAPGGTQFTPALPIRHLPQRYSGQLVSLLGPRNAAESLRAPLARLR